MNIPYFGSQTVLDIVCLIIGFIFAFSWYFTKNWILNNIIGFAMSFLFLKTMRLNKLVPGLILLSLLFFYDIFWVFGSKMFTKDG